MRLIIIAILLVAFAGCRRSDNILTVVFGNVDGLVEGSDVYYKGLVVGDVKRLDLFENRVVADIKLAGNINIPVNSRFGIKRSLIGPATITIEPGNATVYLVSNDTIYGEYSPKQFFYSDSLDTTRQRKVQEAVEKIAEGIKILLEPASKDTNHGLR